MLKIMSVHSNLSRRCLRSVELLKMLLNLIRIGKHNLSVPNCTGASSMIMVFAVNHRIDLRSSTIKRFHSLRRSCSCRPIVDRKPKSSEEPPCENLNVVGNKIKKKLHNTDHEVSVRILTNYMMIQQGLNLEIDPGLLSHMPQSQNESGGPNKNEVK
jgi:hypothetical protein